MKRELQKISDNQYKLVMDDEENRHYQEKGYSKHELKEAYSSLKLQYDQLTHSINAGKKNLESLKVDLTPEEEKMLVLMNKAAKKDQYNKLKEQIDAQTKDFDMYKEQMREIETAIPELKRGGK